MKSGNTLTLSSKHLRVILVSYLNTYPIVWGLKKIAEKYQPEMILCPPSQCSRALLNGRAEIALVPSVTYLDPRCSFEILPFGIVANREVDTVLLVGNRPLEEWDTIFLDEDSLTSVQLAKVLFKLKNLSPKFVSGIEGVQKLKDNAGALLIGDKCFTLASGFSRIYDLSKLWFDLTGLPFVFALFLVHPQTQRQEIETAAGMIREAINVGLENLNLVIAEWCRENSRGGKQKDQDYLYDYLKNKISYFLTPEAIAGLRAFFKQYGQVLPEKEERLAREYFQPRSAPQESTRK